MGLKEHIVFPEINYDQIDQMWGMDIIVCTTAKTDDEARGSPHRIPVPVRDELSGKGREHMAKKSAVNRNETVKTLVKQYAAKRAALKAIANDESLPLEERFEARLKLAKLPRNSAADPHPQPLRGHGPSARLLPQAQDEPDRAARTRLRWARSPASSSRAGKEERQMCQRSPRRHDRPHPERRHAQALQGARPRLPRLRARVLDVLQDEGYIRGYHAGSRSPASSRSSRSS